MKKLLFILSVMLLAGCKASLTSEDEKQTAANEAEIQAFITQNNLKPTKSPTGLYYILTPGTGSRKPQLGEQITFTFTMHRLNGQLIDSTYQTKPVQSVYGTTRLISSMNEGFAYMNEGDRATLLTPYFLGFGTQPITDANGFELFPGYMPMRIEQKLIKTRNESEQIVEYMGANRLEATEETPEGLRFIRTLNAPAGAAAPALDKTVTVTYVGKLLNGREFDKGSYAFRIGASQAIKGFEAGILKMKIGEKATIIFPSPLGYGTQGTTGIPGYSPLLFEVELTAIR